MCGERCVRKRVQLPSAHVAFDRRIELLGVKCLEPRAKPRKLAGREPFNCLFDVFGGGRCT
jgi:hypothetical protein